MISFAGLEDREKEERLDVLDGAGGGAGRNEALGDHQQDDRGDRASITVAITATPVEHMPPRGESMPKVTRDFGELRPGESTGPAPR
jgi:hypothetical protein